MGSALHGTLAWLGVVAAAALPWLWTTRPQLAPVLLVVVWVLWNRLPGTGARGCLAALVIAAATWFNLLFLGTAVIAGSWLGLAAVVALVAYGQPRRVARWRPDAAEILAAGGWASVLAVRPELMQLDHGGWLAPAVLLWATRRAVVAAATISPRARGWDEPAPPSRDARGTLSLRGVVLGSQSVARTVPFDLEMRAGDSLAVLCDSAVDAEVLCAVLAGRVRPLAGEVAVDAVPLQPGDRLVAVIGPGERFLRGNVEANLGALCDEDPEPDALLAAWEACHVDEVVQSLGDRFLESDGAPLDSYRRLLLLAARVIPSTYRVLAVQDRASWLNAVQAEIWRSSVVRASVGRTAVWITTDRELARRATRVMSLRHGALRPVAAGAMSGDGG